ncbi:MAG: PD-(D/E)XK nuclease family protein [Firmicutes bacterium]|nr:PD-(D/E)XK nuclease family protein [Bacillota bacterium]
MVWDKNLDGGRYRPFAWRDAVILLRSTRTVAQKVLEVLQAAGIPAHADAGTGYFEALEVQTILSLLRVIDNPRQDIPLAAVLRAPFAGLGLSPEDLARIRLCYRQGSFYDAVVRAAALADGPGAGDGTDTHGGASFADGATAPDGTAAGGEPLVPPELARRLAAFLRQLDRWRTLARQEPLSQLLWQLYEETGYLYYVAGLPGGAQRRANLLALYDRARQFDQFARQGLFRFLRFVDNLRDRKEDVGPAPALSDQADVVRVMSIHKSKGLEFPVVLVLGLGRNFNTQDERAPVLRHRDLGLGPAVVDPELRCQYPSLAHRAIAVRLRREMLAEEMRVLYVALTRARERLVLMGSCRDLAQAAATWARSLTVPDWPLPDTALAGARSYLDWIGPALIRHRDGAPLRELAGVPAAQGSGPVWTDPSRWAVRVVPGDRARAPEWPIGPAEDGTADRDPAAGAAATRAGEPAGGDEVAAGREAGLSGADLPWERILAGAPLPEPPAPTPQREALAARLAWQYPYQRLTQVPAKETVTGVKHLFSPGAPGEREVAAADPGAPEVAAEEEAVLFGGDSEGELERLEGPVPVEYRLQPMVRPRFLQEHRSLTPAERGTVIHLFLQHIQLVPPLDLTALAAERDRLVRQEILTPEQAEAIDLEAVAAFFRHPLGQRLLAHPERVRREVAFTYSLPARALDPSLPPGPEGEEPVLLQGMIDCLLDEPSGLVLIDFKTDRLRPEQVPMAVARYSGQITLYARAIADIWGRPVREAWLYFLGPGRAEPVLTDPWGRVGTHGGTAI